jgi:hypothetical protein
LQDRHCRTRHCTHPPIYAEYTSTLLSVHAIWGSASAPTAEHQRRRPGTAGDRAGKQNRQFIGALVERFRHFSDLLLHLVALIPVKKILTRLCWNCFGCSPTWDLESCVAADGSVSGR